MADQFQYAEVILPVPVRTSFTYLVPVHLKDKIRAGIRVLVPFGKRKLYSGIVSGISSRKPEYKDIKTIDSVLDEKPVVSSVQISFWNWIADYYMCTVGEVYRAALPAGLRLESETRIMLAEGEIERQVLNSEEEMLISRLQGKGSLRLHDLQNDREGRQMLGHMQSLVARGMLQAVSFAMGMALYPRPRIYWATVAAIKGILE